MEEFIMKAIVKTKRGPGAEILDVDEPKIGPHDVLIKVKASSICGTDVHIWDWNEWADERIKNLPLVFGHEFSGEVIEVGEEVTSVSVGDFVSAETHIVDGTCYQCKTDRMHVCKHMKIIGVDRPGAFAEYIAIPELNAWKNDKHLDPYIASIQEPLGNAVHTVLPKDNIEDIAGKFVGVFGCGPIGLMAIAVLKEIGAALVVATEKGSNVRLSLAKKMGADVVINVDEEDPVKVINDVTDGHGLDVALEMSGSPVALNQAFETLTPGGRVSILAIYDKPVTLDLNNHIVFKSATVYGITGRRMFQTWYQMKGLLRRASFREKIESVITHKIPIKDFEKGIELLHKKEAAKVALIQKWD